MAARAPRATVARVVARASSKRRLVRPASIARASKTRNGDSIDDDVARAVTRGRTSGKENRERRARGGGGGRGGEIQSALASATSAEDALEIVERELEAFDAVHCATALHRVAKYSGSESRLERDSRAAEGLTRDGRFAALAKRVSESVREMDAYGLANVAWSFAKIGYTPGQETLSAIASTLETEIGKPEARVKPQSLSNATYAFGKMRFKPPKSTLEALCSATERAMVEFRADEFSGMLLGLAHLDHVPDQAFLDSATAFMQQNLRRFDDAATCNVLWAYARMEKPLPSEIIDTLLSQLAGANLGGAHSHVNVPMCLYACARLNHQPPPVFVRAVDQEIPRCAKRMNIGSLDSVFWALGTLGGTGEGQLSLSADAYEAVCEAVAAKHDVDVELVAKVFWGLAKVNYRPRDSTLVGLARMAKSRAKELSDDNILLIMHAWGVLRWNPGEELVQEYARIFIDAERVKLNPGQAAKLLCAYGRVRWLPPSSHAQSLIEILVDEAEQKRLHPATAVLGLWGASLLALKLETKQLDALARDTIKQDLSPRSLAKCVWALAALGYDPTPIDLASLKTATDAAWGKLAVKDQAALKQALTRMGI